MKVTDAVRDLITEVVVELDEQMGLTEQHAPWADLLTRSGEPADLPTLHLDDVSEIPFLKRVVGMEYYQLRARVRARSGDVYVATCKEVPGYEPYNRQRLGLGEPEFVWAPPVGEPSAVADACRLGSPLEPLCDYARAAGWMRIHPYMGSNPVWKLARTLAEESGARVTVQAPPPHITWLANDKERTTWLAEALLGDGILGAAPVTETLQGDSPQLLADHLRFLAARHQRVALKMTRCASAMGNEVFESRDILGMEPAAVVALSERFLVDKEWVEGDEVLAVAWIEATASPSTQLWIPPLGDGDPRIDGVYEQLLEGDEGIFLGAVPSRLGEKVDRQCAEASFRMALAYQQLGYVGRCSFDFILADGVVHLVECNGRWGGTSTPMHLVNRLFPTGRPPYRARDVIDASLAGVHFDRILGALGDELYDHSAGRGRFILYNVGCLKVYGKLDVISVGGDLDDASYGLEDLLPRLFERVA